MARFSVKSFTLQMHICDEGCMKLAHRLFIKQSYKLFDCKKILFTNQKFFGRSYLQGLCLFFKFILSNFCVKQDNHNVPRTTGIKSPMPYCHHINILKHIPPQGALFCHFLYLCPHQCGPILALLRQGQRSALPQCQAISDHQCTLSSCRLICQYM